MIRNTATAERATIFIYDEIEMGPDTMSAKQFAADLAKVRHVKELVLRINSLGGSVAAARAMANQLRAHGAKSKVAIIDSVCASSATYLACACDRVQIASDGLYMVHQPTSRVAGTSADMRLEATVLDTITDGIVKLYQEFTNLPRSKVVELVGAETWLDAGQAVALGFAHEIIGRRSVAPPEKLARMNFKRVPQHLLRQRIRFIRNPKSRLEKVKNIISEMELVMQHRQMKDKLAALRR